MSCARGKERKAALDLVDVMEEVGGCLTQHCQALYGNAQNLPEDCEDMDALRNGAAAPPAVRAPKDDIEAQIQGEWAALQGPTKASSRLLSLETDTECMCFIQCSPPVEAGRVVRRVLEDVQRTGLSRSRCVLCTDVALCSALRRSMSCVVPSWRRFARRQRRCLLAFSRPTGRAR